MTTKTDEIKAVVCDADGMMIHGERPSLRLVRDYGIPKEKVDEFFDTVFKDCILGKRDLKEVVVPYLLQWGWKGTMEDLLHFWFAESYKVDEKMREAVSELRAKGIVCVLATNQEKYRVSYMKNEMGLGKLFDFVIASSDVGIKKPARAFFDALMKSLPGIEKGEVFFWDDRTENVEAARQYGMQAKLFTNYEEFYVSVFRKI